MSWAIFDFRNLLSTATGQPLFWGWNLSLWWRVQVFMRQKVGWILAAAAVAAFAAGDQSWKDKQVSEWSDDDVQEVLTSSPWARMSVPEFTRAQNGGQQGMGRRGGFGGGGIGMGGGGWGGRGGSNGGSNGGYGGNNGGYGQQRQDDPDQNSSGDSRQSRNVTVRWESALPVQNALLKSKETGTPSIDADHYAISVIGVPNRIANSDSGKPKAELKREGKKTIKSSDARVIALDKGTMVMFLFPRSQEITATDKQISFDAHIGRMHVTQSFYLTDMIYRGKLEL